MLKFFIKNEYFLPTIRSIKALIAYSPYAVRNATVRYTEDEDLLPDTHSTADFAVECVFTTADKDDDHVNSR